MIRKLLNGDINRVADIWLKTNLKAHYFISNQYWKSNYELVKEMMPQSEVYVFEADKMIQGFVGLNDEYIEGIFVSDEMQSCGIGKFLLDYIKDKKVRLQLNVYQKNTRAISFYQREGFIIQCEGLDEATGEKEYTMLWKRKQKSDFHEEILYEKKLLGVISFCINNSIAVDWIRISRSYKVYFFDNYISSNRFICDIIAEIIKVNSEVSVWESYNAVIEDDRVDSRVQLLA